MKRDFISGEVPKEVFGEVRGMKIPYPTVIALRAKTMQERVREEEVGRKIVSRDP